MYRGKRPFNEVIDLVGDVVRWHMNPIIRARELGTLDAIDRSKQYDEPDPREVLRAVNEAWAKIRRCENELTKKDAAIAELRQKLKNSHVVNSVLTAIITALAVKGLEVLFEALR